MSFLDLRCSVCDSYGVVDGEIVCATSGICQVHVIFLLDFYGCQVSLSNFHVDRTLLALESKVFPRRGLFSHVAFPIWERDCARKVFQIFMLGIEQCSLERVLFLTSELVKLALFLSLSGRSSNILHICTFRFLLYSC